MQITSPMAFPAVNNNGDLFAKQFANRELNPFQVLALPADDPKLTLRGVRAHIRLVVIPHVFERDGGLGLTMGPRVPRLVHVNAAKEMLQETGDIERQRAVFAGHFDHTWNPYADPGSAAAKLPWLATPCSYHAPDVEEFRDKSTFPGFTARPGSAENLVDLDMDDEAGFGSASSPPHTPRRTQENPFHLTSMFRHLASMLFLLRLMGNLIHVYSLLTTVGD